MSHEQCVNVQLCHSRRLRNTSIQGQLKTLWTSKPEKANLNATLKKKTAWPFLKILKIELYNTAILLLGLYPKKLKEEF